MKLAIAGGGTGGHLFPAIAVVQEFLKRDPLNEVLFIGSEGGLEKEFIPQLGYQIKFLTISGLKGKNLKEVFLTLFYKIPLSLWESLVILKEFKPEIVIGVGGYSSGPFLLASFLKRIKKTTIMEQNLKPGFTNQILSYLVKKIFISYEKSKIYFPVNKTFLTGTPVRWQPEEVKKEKKDKFYILILGGSQGAHSINEKIIEALPYLKEIEDKIFITHQTGKNDLAWVKESYGKYKIAHEIKDFIIEMNRAYNLADLVICRAGASTLAELALLKKAAILIPYPYAIYNHQFLNAQVLVEKEAAEMITTVNLTGLNIANNIKQFFKNPLLKENLEKNISSLAHPQAAKEIVDEIIQPLP